MSDEINEQTEGNIGATPGWVKRDPTEDELEKIYDYTSEEMGFITSVLDDEKLDDFSPTYEWDWEQYQLDHLEHGGWWIGNKCRQSGLSTSFAAKAFARGILTERNYTAIFVSYKRDEAINKINYVKQFLDALPPRFRKPIIRDPMQLIEWKNNNGTRSKIISHAQRPIRGINGDVFLDELAFYQFADEIYTSALPAVGGARGTLDITSTPFGAGDKFYEIMTDRYKFSEFKRVKIFWWQVMRYLKEQSLEFLVKAEMEAPKMSTEERVMKFGNDVIKQQFKNADDLESFQQEFEAFFIDAQAAFFTKNLIMNCMFPEFSSMDDYNPREDDFNIDVEEALVDFNFPIVQQHHGMNFKKYNTLHDLYDAVRAGEVTPNLIAGADIGMTRHSTDFTIFEEVVKSNGQTVQVERFSKNEQDWPLPQQQTYFDNVLSDGFVKKLNIDATGVGSQMGQYLEDKWGDSVVKAIQLGGSSKKVEKYMVNLRARMENSGMALAYDRLTLEDVYAIKRVITSTKSVSFRADEKKRHHADRAFSIALASAAGTMWGQEPSQYKMSSDLDVGKIKRLRDKKTGLPDDKTRKSLNERIASRGLNLKARKAFVELSDPGRYVDNWDD